MKTSEIVQQYAQGQRDFQGLNLRGFSFKNQDLSGADFSGADIRSTNFCGAGLQGTRFVGAKAGLQKRWIIWVVIVVFILTALPQFFFILNSLLMTRRVTPEYFANNSTNIVASRTAFVIYITFLILILCQSFPKVLTLMAFVGAFIGSVAFMGNETIAFNGFIALRGVLFAVRTVAEVFTFAYLIAVSGSAVGAFKGFIALRGVLFAVGTVVEVFAAYLRAVSEGTVGAFTYAVLKVVPEAVAGLFTFTFLQVLIYDGVSFYVAHRAMKGEEKYALIRNITVAFAALGGTCFRGTDLTEADFTSATLKNTDFRESNLTRTSFKKANLLDLDRPGKSILSQEKVRELVVSRKGKSQNFSKVDLRGANLNHADLSYTNLTQADLSQATLHQADLEGANLTEINAIGTNFSQATLTAACVEAWNIDSTTQFDQVKCDYIYLLNHQQERRPSSGVFAPGEFTQLF